jgi:hypothetical protein
MSREHRMPKWERAGTFQKKPDVARRPRKDVVDFDARPLPTPERSMQEQIKARLLMPLGNCVYMRRNRLGQ